MNTVDKIKKAKLVGCGGACFPTSQKWDAVKKAKGNTKYVVCNGSEGEPNVFKDGYILEKHPERVIDGMKLAIDFLQTKNKEVKGYFYINHKYYNKYGKKIKALIKKQEVNIEIFIKPDNAGYIGGEETVILNLIEGNIGHPRLKPPYPTTNGLFDSPTIINNIETFYQVSLINDDKYEGNRFYSVNGDILKKGVFELAGGLTIKEVLEKTKSLPRFNFFVQVGGGASGEILNSEQLDIPVSGSMSITVYKMSKWEPIKLIKKWVKFFVNESCGQCTPCREGNYRLLEILESKQPDWALFVDLLENLHETSFCGLGITVPIPINSYVKNVLSNKKIKIASKHREDICKSFE